MWLNRPTNKNSKLLRIDPASTALCGHSAGGNLAAAITLMNQQRHDFSISLQILDYPCLDLYTPPQLKRNAYNNLQKIPRRVYTSFKGVC